MKTLIILLLFSTTAYAQSDTQTGSINLEVIETVEVEHINNLDFGQLTTGTHTINSFSADAGRFDISDIQGEFIIHLESPDHLTNGDAQIPITLFWQGATTRGSQNGLQWLESGSGYIGIKSVYYGASVTITRHHLIGAYNGTVRVTVEVL